MVRSNVTWYCTQHCSNSDMTYIRICYHKGTPYLALTGELWRVICESFLIDWSCYNGTCSNNINPVGTLQINAEHATLCTYLDYLMIILWSYCYLYRIFAHLRHFFMNHTALKTCVSSVHFSFSINIKPHQEPSTLHETILTGFAINSNLRFF